MVPNSSHTVVVNQLLIAARVVSINFVIANFVTYKKVLIMMSRDLSCFSFTKFSIL